MINNVVIHLFHPHFGFYINTQVFQNDFLMPHRVREVCVFIKEKMYKNRQIFLKYMMTLHSWFHLIFLFFVSHFHLDKGKEN